ncbi:MAG: hypothetical protein O9264_08810 [Leptospira sp.]|nr:hypothetical protein [Leptospira sp.]
MKRLFILLVFILPFCSTIEKKEGSISRQLDLIEDLEAKLPPEDRQRFRKGIENIRQEERISDSTIIKNKDIAEDAQEKAFESSNDAGKWEAIRNTAIAIFISFLCYVGFLGLKKYVLH